MSTRLEIDWTRCDGHGLCARLAPEALTLAADGFPVLRTDAPADADKHLRRAASACPALALRTVSSSS